MRKSYVGQAVLDFGGRIDVGRKRGRVSEWFFVPKGLIDGSQAVYCLECGQNHPSRRVRFDLVCWLAHRSRSQNVPCDPIIPFPTGRFLSWTHSRQ
jgi:hypothetical protein